MIDTLNADKLRALAAECAAQAEADGCSAEARTRYLKMHESLLALVDNAEWLNGNKPANKAAPAAAGG